MRGVRKRASGGDGGGGKRVRGSSTSRDVRRSSSPLTPPPELEPRTPSTHVSHPVTVPPDDLAASQPQPVSAAGLETYRLDLDAGDVLYIPDFVGADEAGQWYDVLHALDTWHHPTLTVYGRPVVQSRAVAVYAASPGSMKYSGTSVPVHSPMPPPLDVIRARVEERLGERFSTCMLNLYEDGGVYIGRHSDTRENRTIASLSLGAERTFVMTPRLPPREAGAKLSKERKAELENRQPLRFKMASGSLVVMRGATQDYWKHEIPKEPKVKTGRISLTFRQLD